MTWRTVLLFLGMLLSIDAAFADEVLRYKLGMIALTEDPQVRADFEDGLVAKFRDNGYDAVTTHDVIPEVADLDNADVVARLTAVNIQAVLMMRPAAVGAGSSLESVKDDVPAEVYASMRSFAKQISPLQDDDELVAVIHTAIYLIKDRRTELLSSGAVWLDKPVETQEEGIAKLQDLIVVNMNKARPAIRRYLGLPPLKKN